MLADHFDRRRILVLCPVILAAAGAVLAGLSYAHVLRVAAILTMALLAGSASALSAPAFQAIVPSPVPVDDVRPAAALSSISFNIPRVIRPAAGGAILAAAGAASAYACNVAGYLVTIAALLLIRTAPGGAPAPTDRLPGRASPGLRLRRAKLRLPPHPGPRHGALSLRPCDLALTPLIAHDVLGRSPGVDSELLAATGAVSIAGGVVLSFARRTRLTDEALLSGCSMADVLALAMLASAFDAVVASCALALAGGATLIQLATLNAAAQQVLPPPIRGRGLSIYMAATFGCMAVGSLLWGGVSDTFSIPAALFVGAPSFVAPAALGGFARLSGT